MTARDWDQHFKNSKKLYHLGKYDKSLKELKVCMGGVEKDFAALKPTPKALEITQKFSNIIYWRILCFYSAGKNCCAKKNVYFVYDQLRSIFLNPSFDGKFRNSIRTDLKKIYELYRKFQDIDENDNLAQDFLRIYYTKILI